MAPLTSIEQSSIKTSTFLSRLALLPALISLAGWIFSHPILYKYAERFPAMTIETVMGVAIGTLSICLFNHSVRRAGDQAKMMTRSAVLFAILLAIIGSATILFYLLYGAELVYSGQPVPRELSSPRTSIAFLFLGLGTIFGAVSDRYRLWSLILLAFPFYIALIALTGYVLSVASYYGFQESVGMSIPTSISIILLTLASVLGPLRQVGGGFLLALGRGGEVARFLLPITLFFPPLCTWIVWSTYRADFFTISMAIVLLTVIPCLFLSLVVSGLAIRLTWTERQAVSERAARETMEEEYRRYRELESARAHLVALVESSADAIFSEGDGRKITFSNQAAQELFGYSQSETLSMKFSDFLRTEELHDFEEKLKEVKQGQIVQEYETCGIRKDNSEVDISISLAPILTQQNQIKEVSIIVRDISKLKSELKLRNQMAEELRRASVAKDEFLAVLSHELRTPLNVILGYSDILPDLDYQSEEYNQALESIRRNAVEEAKLVEDILDMTSILTGTLKIEPEVFNIRDLINEVIQSNRLAMDAKQLNVETDLDPSVSSVEGDKGRIRQVISNLVSNSIKFTPENGAIRVLMKRRRTRLEVRIIDTGVGITEDKLPFIFQRFYQVDSSYTRDYGGMGIGLSLVKHIVEAHGGSITAKSDGLNKGAEFIIILPFVQTGSRRS